MATQSNVVQANGLTQIWNFEKLKGQVNYLPWSNMKSALRFSGLWEVVESNKIFLDDLPTALTPTNAQVLTYDAAVKL